MLESCNAKTIARSCAGVTTPASTLSAWIPHRVHRLAMSFTFLLALKTCICTCETKGLGPTGMS